MNEYINRDILELFEVRKDLLLKSVDGQHVKRDLKKVNGEIERVCKIAASLPETIPAEYTC